MKLPLWRSGTGRRRPSRVSTYPFSRRLGEGRWSVFLDLGESFLVAVDVLGRLGARDPLGLGEAEGALAVDDAEVDRLGDGPHLAGDLIGGHVEEAGSGLGVDVGAAAKASANPPVPPHRWARIRSSTCE